MNTETFRVYNDPQHGWVAVKRAAKYGTAPTFVSSHTNRSSRIRSYESFRPEGVA